MEGCKMEGMQCYVRRLTLSEMALRVGCNGRS